ncbi:MAG TPA: ABC transporter ATP-binding protein [Blastocatellia bacterium]|jgi:simple sugar transport system ATP-binding protein|nr:ABC transporter ATP-binding protein [Blastocatellia bacterium]
MSEEPKYAVEMRGVTKQFGDVVANDQIDLRIPAQSIHAIVGENGAGKSTAMNILYGFYKADRGEILIDGAPRSIDSPRDAIALGLGMVHQHFMLVEPLSVTENIVLGAEPTSGLAIDYKSARARVREISGQYGLRIDPDARVGNLSVGQQQRVEILKTLYRGARVLILDEPTAVLTPQEVEEMFAILRGLREQGKTIIIITHKLEEVLSLSDNITVMRDGHVVGDLATREATAAGLARMMVGREVLLRVVKREAEPRGVVLSVGGLALGDKEGSPVLDGISFEIRGGEILGIAGVEGNGQTELIEVLAGLRRPSEGSVVLNGREIGALDPYERKRLGIAHIPEDRHRRGLLLNFDLASNSILGVHKDAPVSGRVLLDQQVIVERARRLVSDYDVRPPDINLPARALSGGNQQKLIVAREFDIKPKLVLVSQPTRGVDIGATEFIHGKLVELRDGGAGVLLVSAELDEVLSLSDRVMVIYEGRIVGEVDPKSASVEQIGLMMAGGRQGEAT